MPEDVQASYYEESTVKSGVRAPVQTQTHTLDVSVEDTNGDTTIFKIDNPKDDLSLATVQTVFAYAINTSHWVSKNNFRFTQVKSAKRTVIIKTVETLD